MSGRGVLKDLRVNNFVSLPQSAPTLSVPQAMPAAKFAEVRKLQLFNMAVISDVHRYISMGKEITISIIMNRGISHNQRKQEGPILGKEI